MESILYVEQEQVTWYAEKKRVKNVRPCESDWLVFTERLKYFMLFMTKGLFFQALTLSCQSVWNLKSVIFCNQCDLLQIWDDYSTQGKESYILYVLYSVSASLNEFSTSCLHRVLIQHF